MEKDENAVKKSSDDKFDAIAAILLVGVFVAGLTFWLSGMPS